MATLSKEICKEIAIARRERGLTQTALAAEVGCKQSAISMLESGQTSKLSKENIEKVLTVLGLTLHTEVTRVVSATVQAEGFCPNAYCPSAVPYLIQDHLVFQPRLQHGKHCAYCGELLETGCPHCAAPIHAEGAYCPLCGEARVTDTLPPEIPRATWVAERRRELMELHQLTAASHIAGASL
jgi:transcriptional regulator with XRE-family HTH domain